MWQILVAHPMVILFLLANGTPSLPRYDTDYSTLWECRTLLQVQGRNYDWSKLVIDIPLLIANDWRRVRHVNFFWIVRHKGKSLGVQGFSSLHLFFFCVRCHQVVMVVSGVILSPSGNKPKGQKATHWGWQRGETEWWAWVLDDTGFSVTTLVLSISKILWSERITFLHCQSCGWLVFCF